MTMTLIINLTHEDRALCPAAYLALEPRDLPLCLAELGVQDFQNMCIRGIGQKDTIFKLGHLLPCSIQLGLVAAPSVSFLDLCLPKCVLDSLESRRPEASEHLCRDCWIDEPSGESSTLLSSNRVVTFAQVVVRLISIRAARVSRLHRPGWMPSAYQDALKQRTARTQISTVFRWGVDLEDRLNFIPFLLANIRFVVIGVDDHLVG